jgi:hypothetical protein
MDGAMNYPEQANIEYAYEKLSTASQILSTGDFRDRIPDAWVSALMRLKRDVHVPPIALPHFDFLSSEMNHCLEPGQRGLRFKDGTSEDAVRDIEIAYWHVHAAVVLWFVPLLSEWMDAAACVNQQVPFASDVLADTQFWKVADIAADYAPGIGCLPLTIRERSRVAFTDYPLWRVMRALDSAWIDSSLLENFSPTDCKAN